MLDMSPAKIKSIADLRQAVLACISRGCFRSLESVFAENNSLAPWRPPNIEKLNEQLLCVTPLPLDVGGRLCMFVQPTWLYKCIEKASLSQNERKKLRQSLLKVDFESEQGSQVLWKIVLTLSERGFRLSTIFGLEGTVKVHYSEDLCRFRHAAGLADAVHMSLFNLNINVSFPQRTYVRLTSLNLAKESRRSLRERIRFKETKWANSVICNGSPYLLFQRKTTSHRKWRLISFYLTKFKKGQNEKTYVKIIKESLVDTFCVQAEQERPLVEETIPLFPPLTQNKLDKLFARDRKSRVRFYKNLLESKSLCAPVGDDMIRDAYKKHLESLCRPLSDQVPVPEDFLQELREYGRQVGKWIGPRYRPNETRLPNRRACLETNRASGGARAALRGSREIHKGPLYLSMLHGASRPEPFVIGLFGHPGCGKTTMLSSLIPYIGSVLFSHLSMEELVYSRSCSTIHWDGYKGQPIVVIDDIGQNLQDRSDLVEFEQLVSTNRYHLPMAHLDDKGMCFTSPIIIATSNMTYCSVLRDKDNKCIIENDSAFWRRFHLPLVLSRVDGEKRFSLMRSSGAGLRSYQEMTALQENFNPRLPSFFRNSHVPSDGVELQPAVEAVYLETMDLMTRILTDFRKHTDFHAGELSGYWRQNISCFGAEVRQVGTPFYDVHCTRKTVAHMPNDITISQIFPRFPPYHLPVVEAIALPEPLKVRMITKAEAETKCLQPLQRVLFDYLKSCPQFALTHGVSWSNNETFDEKLEWIYRIEGEIKAILGKSNPGELWLSGDYKSATDEFPLSVTSALVEGILDFIDHEPTRAWLRYETGAHVIRYPHLPDGHQTSGQLMGSLISFPLLCFLNDFIIRRSGFEPGKYLINGDDVVARGTSDAINQWRCDAPKVGLSLSLGKNFIDPSFCTVNSQLFWEGEVLHTGKVSCQTRYGKSLSRCFSETQFYYGTEERILREFVRRNIIPLRETPRSLCVPTCLGGLGLVFSNFGKVDWQLAKRVYIYDFLQPFHKSLPVPGMDFLRAVNVPTGIFTDDEFNLGGGDPEEVLSYEILQGLDMDPAETDSVELSNSAFIKREKEYRRGEVLRPFNQLMSHDIRAFPNLGSIRTRVVYVQKGKVGFLKERIQRLALDMLVDHIRMNPSGTESDVDVQWVEISRNLMFDEDPLFGVDFQLPHDLNWEDNRQEEQEEENDLFPNIQPVMSRGLLPTPRVQLLASFEEEFRAHYDLDLDTGERIGGSDPNGRNPSSPSGGSRLSTTFASLPHV